jgi:hypothetical protein
VSKDARKRLARAKAGKLKTPNFRRRGLEVAGELERRANGETTPRAEKMRALATGIRMELGGT